MGMDEYVSRGNFWFAVALTAAFAFVGGGAVGFFAGKTVEQGKLPTIVTQENVTREEVTRLLDTAYPKPSGELFGLSGTIEKIEGSVIFLVIRHPDDYLPTQEPRAQTRKILVIEATYMSKIDFANVDAEGNFLTKKITVADLKPGNVITVTADEKIKYKESFAAKTIELSR